MFENLECFQFVFYVSKYFLKMNVTRSALFSIIPHVEINKKQLKYVFRKHHVFLFSDYESILFSNSQQIHAKFVETRGKRKQVIKRVILIMLN